MKKIIKPLVSLVILAYFLVFFSPAGGIDGLSNPRDIINNSSLEALSTHIIRFGLPVSSPAILATDYIFIDMPYFSGVTEPTSITGNVTGTPQYTVMGTRIRITGIVVMPGGYITIDGITSYNPEAPDTFNIYINVASDPDGLVVRNAASVYATPTDGSVIVSASIPANVGTLRISGQAAPGMFITFTQGGTTIGTTVASASGNFMQVFPGISPTNITHTILAYGTDGNGLTTTSTVVEVFVRAYEVTSVSGIIIPPTIRLDKDQIERGESITISGYGIPGFKAKIFTEPPLNSFEADVSDDGSYSYTISDTADMILGDHKVYCFLQDIIGSQSLVSLNVFFRVIDRTDPTDPGGDTDCDIGQGDLNCDTHVNLTDFSILLYYWAGTDVEADINKDGNVNLVDFSIMMFYWGG